ncbi:hypothetical protein INS49_010385 [Diaporthe citri]|uniref:uncharacterized protein n=1 Tax=Diaporthe citri TaxID=83186 RepID=UPI001C7E4BFE|nr:uncharacterized protein INS49_010385 [Diaporthe citri]KAG6362156.1 hypothetical protein INS49_010385 [Diaporthe citri]
MRRESHGLGQQRGFAASLILPKNPILEANPANPLTSESQKALPKWTEEGRRSTVSVCKCENKGMEFARLLQIWPDFTPRGDGMNQGVWTEGMTSQSDRLDNDDNNNNNNSNKINCIKRANNGGTGLGILSMGQPCSR